MILYFDVLFPFIFGAGASTVFIDGTTITNAGGQAKVVRRGAYRGSNLCHELPTRHFAATAVSVLVATLGVDPTLLDGKPLWEHLEESAKVYGFA